MANEIIKNNEEKGRCVYRAQIARPLIHRGYTIIDIKPKDSFPDETVFVFRETENFNKDLEEVLNDYKDKKEKRRLNKLQRELIPDTADNAE